MIYRGIDRFFFIGELNRKHYLAHGVAGSRLRPARYATIDRFAPLHETEKENLRYARRQAIGIPSDAWVIGFSGKFIPKKHPDFLFEIVGHLPIRLRKRVWLYFLGSGEMEDSLKIGSERAAKEWGISCHFAGFANQSELPAHYLAMDCLVVPSRRMGETWGLVVNEAMQSGCAVAVSEAVGCSEDFRDWERFRVFRVGDAHGAASALAVLSEFPRSFCWASERLGREYSIKATSDSLVEELRSIVCSY